jgi:probable HAF family extracellular repeat protein
MGTHEEVSMQWIIGLPALCLLAVGCGRSFNSQWPNVPHSERAADVLSIDDFDYVVIRLPASFGASRVLVERANTRGDLVGRYMAMDETGEQVAHGFVRRNGVFETLHVEGAQYTYAQGINERGDIVGTYVDARGEHGFLYVDARFTTFDAKGATGTRFYDISGNGVIAGSYNIGDKWQPAVWIDGVFTPLTALTAALGSDMAEAFGINALGQVVGHFTLPGSSLDASGQKMYGFLYQDGSILATFDFPGSGPMSCSWEVGEQGEVLGHYADPQAGGVTGYLWQNGTFTGQLRVPGATETYPMTFGANGTIAGAALLATGEHVGFSAAPRRRNRMR